MGGNTVQRFGRHCWKRFLVFISLAFLVFLGTAHAAVIEDDQTRIDVAADKAVVQFAGETLVVAADYFLASPSWGKMFPRIADPSVFDKNEGLLDVAVWDKAGNKAAFTFQARPLGAHVELTATIPPGYGAKFAVWDLFLNKAFFTGATLRRPGVPDITLTPKGFTQQNVGDFSFITPEGEWAFSLKGDHGTPWKIRSVCERTWGPDDKRTFDLLWQFDEIPVQGLTFHLAVDMTFRPSPAFLATRAKLNDLIQRAVFVKLNHTYGGGVPPALDTRGLSDRVAALSANLREDRVNPQSPRVVPQPKEISWGKGAFSLPAAIPAYCNLPGPLSLLVESFAALGATVTRDHPGGTPTVVLALASDPVLQNSSLPLTYLEGKKEAYLLSVRPSGVVVAASDLAGLVHGVQTLNQILRLGESGIEVPLVEIRDFPDLAFRGFYLEGAGKILGTDEFRRLLRNTYSRFHGNAVVAQIRWSHFQWKTHPEIAGPQARPLSDLARSAQEARELGIEFIPALFSYGRVEDLLKTHPEIAEHPDWAKNGGAWCPNKKATYDLFFDLLKEVVEVTGSQRVHIGHDEIQGMALCPACKAEAPGDLFARDVNRIADFLAERGVGTMIWGDLLLDHRLWTPLGVFSANSANPYYGGLSVHLGLEKIRKSVVICDWHYEDAKAFPTFKHFADSGHAVIGCPWYSSKNSTGIARAIGAVKQLGVLVTDWGFLGNRAPGAVSILGVTHGWNLSQPDAEGLTWNPVSTLAASLLPADRPSRKPGAKFTPIPLGTAANRNLAGDSAAWFRMGTLHDLTWLPQGDVMLFNTPYHLGSRAAVVGPPGSGLPKAQIPVGQKARSLVVLHALQVDEIVVGSRTYGMFRINYRNGKTAEAAITHRTSAHWLSDAPRKNPWGTFAYNHTWDSLLAWEGVTRRGEAVNLQAFEWVNPQPDEPVASLEVAVDGAARGVSIGLVALTAVE